MLKDVREVKLLEKQIDRLLIKAFQARASDVHLTVTLPPVFRINGQLVRQEEQQLKPLQMEHLGKEMLTEQEWEQFLKEKELDFAYEIAGISRFRGNIFKQRGEIALAIRLIPTQIPTIDELKLPKVLKEMVTKPQGLVLVTGPTGSGKSTTLAAMIDYLNKTVSRHIITLEDPIEYIHHHHHCIIDQREVGYDTNAFTNGLRACLRQDPDVILVGELRDLETIQTAITAAETGHLVLSTLHTKNAASTIDRIIDIFPATHQAQIRVQLASVLVAVVSQRLIPYASKTGRIAATEVLINIPAVANLIRSEKVYQIANVLQTNKAVGMHTLEMNLKELVQHGIIKAQEATVYQEIMNHGSV